MNLESANIVVLTGVGKSSIVAELGASLLQSVGVRAVAVSATDLLHGSLGLLAGGGVLIALSHSGTTYEVRAALKCARELQDAHVDTHLITGNIDAALDGFADTVHSYLIDADGSRHGTIPVKSVRAQLHIISTWVVEIADKLDPLDLQSYHPHGSLAVRYEQEAEGI